MSKNFSQLSNDFDNKTPVLLKTAYLKLCSLIIAGLFTGSFLFWLLRKIPDGSTSNSKILLIYSVSVLSLIFVLSISIGTPGAKILLNFFLSYLDSYISRTKEKLKEYSHRSNWQGRRFLDILRNANHSSLRREFLALGLDAQLRIPDEREIDEIDRISSVLFLVENEAKRRGLYELGAHVNNIHNQLRNLIYLSYLRFGLVWLVNFIIPSLLFLLGSYLLDDIPFFRDSPILKEVGSEKLFNTAFSLTLLAASPLATYLVGRILFFLTWRIGKRTETQIDDLLLMLISWAIGGIVGLTLVYNSLVLFEQSPKLIRHAALAFFLIFAPSKFEQVDEVNTFFYGLQPNTFLFFRASVILGSTVLLVILLRGLCNRVLRQIAARTKQKYDDMMVEIVRIFGTFILIALGVGWIFMVFVAQYSNADGKIGDAGPLMPYAILVAVAGGILGIGSRDMLENFFAGISIQIDKPFETNERVILEDGAICEVRSVGMRSTHFYNITENTDLYVPNSKLAQQTVSNLSRPDREYRQSLRVYVKDEEKSLTLAEGLVLFAALSTEGIDIPTVIDEQFEGSMFQRNRRGIVSEFSKLQDNYDECANAVIKLHGQTVSVSEVVKTRSILLSQAIHEIHTKRTVYWDFSRGRPTENVLKMDRELLDEEADLAHKVSYWLYELSMCFWTIGASYPSIRVDLEHLSLEILRAPSVRSRHKTTEDAMTYWEIELLVYAHLTEQSDEIMHNLNAFIQQLLYAADLLPHFKRDKRE